MEVEAPEELLKTVSSVAESVIQELRPKDDRQINVVLTNDRVIHKLNRAFRKIDNPTDVLSFGYEDEDLLGEIVISLETVKRQAREYGHSYMYELIFNLIHGVLHLCGYDHEDPEQERTMMELQEALIKRHFQKEGRGDESQAFQSR